MRYIKTSEGNTMRKPLLIISIILEVILTPILCTCIPVYISDPDILPLSMVIFLPLWGFTLLTISIVSLKKGTGIGNTILWKFFLSNLILGLSFLGFEDGIYATFLIEIFAVIWLVLLILLRKKKTTVSKTPIPVKKEPFSYKGEWAWDAALEEYLERNNLSRDQEITDDQTVEIYRYTTMPVVYLFYWLLEKGFMSNEFYESMGKERVQDCIDKKLSPLDLLEDYDSTLMAQDMLEGAADFCKDYAEPYFLSLYSDSLIFDYWDEVKNPEGYYYCVDFSWDTCMRMHDRIEKAYANWWPNRQDTDEYYEFDEPISSVYSNRLGRELDVYMYGKKTRDIDISYAQECIANFDSIDPFQFDRLDRWISDQYGDSLRGKVMERLEAYSLYIFEPNEKKEMGYVIAGGATDFEEEHGIGIYVRNSVIYSFGYGYDFEDIFGEDETREYKIAADDIDFNSIDSKDQAERLVAEGKLIKTTLIPEEFGGTDIESNTIYLSHEGYKEKQLLDSRLEAIRASWKNIKYEYAARYYDTKKQIVPINIVARHTTPNGSTRFYFIAKVWT